ncbi:hypothetical protein [Haloarchaeobius amylolyticus]|uniref:hypothetical protein n=1 Tax=Haloarchaeobius amylolyticus TaxID=1198296 RepID=UPI00226FB062|nr:hypothetical protein [Haloarchaeobius amylolyticus]
MQRRVFCAALASTLAGLAGCAGRLPGDQPGARHTPPGEGGYDGSSGGQAMPDGDEGGASNLQAVFELPTGTEGFVVDVVVTNTGATAAEAVFVLTWSKGDRSQERRQSVALESGGEKTYTFEFPAAGDLSLDWEDS